MLQDKLRSYRMVVDCGGNSTIGCSKNNSKAESGEVKGQKCDGVNEIERSEQLSF